MLEKVKKIIERAFPDVDASGITEDTRLSEDLGFDSLSFMMLAMEIEDSFGFKFREFVKFETVGDACRYLESRI